MNNAFGLSVDVKLNADETPLEVVGCLKYLDADGDPNYVQFASDDLMAVEAVGMLRFATMQTEDDLQTAIYLTMDDDD